MLNFSLYDHSYPPKPWVFVKIFQKFLGFILSQLESQKTGRGGYFPQPKNSFM